MSDSDLTTALKLAEECVELTRDIYSEKHTAYASSLVNLGLVLKHRGELDRAIKTTEEAKELYQTLVPRDHPSIAALLTNLSLMYLSRVQKEKPTAINRVSLQTSAVSNLRAALDIRLKAYGPDDVRTATSKYHLATAYRHSNKLDEAERLLLEAVADLRRVAGDAHPATATALNNLGFLLKQRKEYARAGEAYAESLKIRQQLFSKDHPEIIMAMHNIAELKVATGDETGAEQMRTDILRLLGKVTMEGDPVSPS